MTSWCGSVAGDPLTFPLLLFTGGEPAREQAECLTLLTQWWVYMASTFQQPTTRRKEPGVDWLRSCGAGSGPVDPQEPLPFGTATGPVWMKQR